MIKISPKVLTHINTLYLISDIFVPSGVWAVPLSPSPAMTTPDVSGEAREEFLNIYSENILQY